MFEDITPESIKAAILAEAGESLETREGSFLDSMAGPAALEIWNLSTTDRRKALSTYEECVSYGTRNDFLAVLSYCNLSSPFDDSTLRSIANSLSSEINQL